MVIAVVAHLLEHYDCIGEELEQMVDSTKVQDGLGEQQFRISFGRFRV